ncbi:MAG: hypothetical protein J5835_03690 [Bacteroidales bacterium]|nr:hypothetical protein [Bacteroidales bacterium]
MRKFLLLLIAVSISLPLSAQERQEDAEIRSVPDYEMAAKPARAASKGKTNIKLPNLPSYENSALDAGLYRKSRSIVGNYHGEAFLNGNYAGRIDSGQINRTPGLGAGLQFVVFYPFALDVSGFFNPYTFSSSSYFDQGVSHYGVELFADCYVLPYLGKVSQFVAPYIGAGYQFSSLSDGKDVFAYTSGFAAKAGIRLYLFRPLFLQAEYKQTLPVTSAKLFRVISLGVGMEF